MRSAIAMNPISEFDKLCAELGVEMRRQEWANGLMARARGFGATGEFRKALSDLADMHAALPPKRRSVMFVRKDAFAKPSAGAEVIAKAFHTLRHGDLNADQRGRLMLALGNVADRVFAKAMPSGAERVEPQSARALAARLKEIQGHLDQHAEASHIAEAERLLADAQRTLANPESMSMGDHAALSIQLDDLRHKIGRNSDAQR
jgi:hypothetical protein